MARDMQGLFDNLNQMEGAIKYEVETMMHDFSFEFLEEGPSGKELRHCEMDLHAIRAGFEALKELDRMRMSFKEMCNKYSNGSDDGGLPF